MKDVYHDNCMLGKVLNILKVHSWLRANNGVIIYVLICHVTVLAHGYAGERGCRQWTLLLLPPQDTCGLAPTSFSPLPLCCSHRQLLLFPRGCIHPLRALFMLLPWRRGFSPGFFTIWLHIIEFGRPYPQSRVIFSQGSLSRPFKVKGSFESSMIFGKPWTS